MSIQAQETEAAFGKHVRKQFLDCMMRIAAITFRNIPVIKDAA